MKLADYIPFYKRNLHLALPVVISQIGQVSVSLVDNMMVGHVGTLELAAASFANNVFVNGARMVKSTDSGSPIFPQISLALTCKV